MTEDSLEIMSAFVKPSLSEYTSPLTQRARNHVGLSAALGYMTKDYCSKIKGEPVPSQRTFQTIPKFKEGFQIRGAGVVVAAAILEVAPEIIWRPDPKLDPQTVEYLDRLPKPYPLPQPQPLPKPRFLPIAKSTERKVKDKNVSVIWAKSQGNTIVNALKDYRYRPQFGGIRIN